MIVSFYKNKGMVVTDLDGTLLDCNKKLKKQDFNTLLRLKEMGFIRVIATGRHLYSLFKTIDDTFPVDFIIFSSGAGLLDLKKKKIIRKISMEEKEVKKAAGVLLSSGINMAVHKPIPDNHFFSYYKSACDVEDFDRRILLYKEFASRWKNPPDSFEKASGLLGIVPKNGGELIYNHVKAALAEYSVIRTTSPLDHTSIWIEIFPKAVSKSQAASWLSAHFGLKRENVLSIGNDYNDIDLLEWAGMGIVVGNAAKELRNRFISVASNDMCGFSEAVNKWL